MVDREGEFHEPFQVRLGRDLFDNYGHVAKTLLLLILTLYVLDYDTGYF
jgi:hypothetical protein